jgi:LysR family glycine cleavage system transcriptional activator
MLLPPLNALRAFEAAARHLSFKKAAEELFVTPGAVSRQIGNLEFFVGQKLFARHNGKVALTEAGHSYGREIAEALGHIAAATAAVRRRAPRHMLKVKLPPTCAMRWLVPRLAGFHALYPEIAVQVMTSHEPVDFRLEDVDVAIWYGNKPASGFHCELLFPEVLIPVCSPLVAREIAAKAPKDLVGQVLLHSIVRPNDWRLWFEAAGVGDFLVDRTILFENSSLTYEGAMAGLGIAIAQLAFVKEELERGSLAVPIDMPLNSAWGYYLIYPRDRASAKIRAFHKWISAAGQKTRESLA